MWSLYGGQWRRRRRNLLCFFCSIDLALHRKKPIHVQDGRLTCKTQHATQKEKGGEGDMGKKCEKKEYKTEGKMELELFSLF